MFDTCCTTVFFTLGQYEQSTPITLRNQVVASQGAFAALLDDKTVVTWGDVDYGGESMVHKESTGLSDSGVVMIRKKWIRSTISC